MNDDNLIISGFDSDADNAAPFAVDFASAKQLQSSGSTCDVYECSIQRRRVFVKRLKAEYRNNPLYRAAFSKEFDLGVSLSHPSLPRYVGFGGDYIVMDFIEGDTLANLIKRNDNRLKDKHFVKKLLRELIDVAEYLHYRNIVHCDIKADNIIISPYPDRPATLIDFDKAYSPWLDSTHGNTAKYGCNGCADGAIDFKGIGLIAAKLGLKKAAKACSNSKISADALKKSLDNKPTGWIILGMLIIVGVVIATSLLYKKPTTNVAETVTTDSLAVAKVYPDSILPSPQSVASQKPSIDNAWISSLISEKAVEIRSLRQKLLSVLDSDTIPAGNKLDAIYDYTYSSGLVITRIIYSAVSHYRNLPETDVQNAVRSNPEWIKLTKEEDDMQRHINDWRIKVSQHPSSHPVSRPDTTQDASLPAQHR